MLQTTRLLLRNFTRDDLEAVHAYGSDPLVTRFMAWGPNRPEDTVRFIDAAVAESTERPRRNFNLAVALRGTGGLIGGCGLDLDVAAEGRRFVLGYCLAAPYWGMGYGTEAVRALVAFGFGELGATRIVAHVFIGNARSGALLRRLGFTNVATCEKRVHVRGEWHDEHEFVRDA
jgi:RimJ/RimL family protein N-acetyltransferase